MLAGIHRLFKGGMASCLRLHRLAPLQPAPLLLAQAFVAAPVNDLHAWIVGIDLFAPEPQVGHDLLVTSDPNSVYRDFPTLSSARAPKAFKR